MREYLKELRKKQNLTQIKIAEKMEIAPSYYTMIETGERQTDMGLSIIQKLADIYDVSVEWIIEQETALKKTG